MDLKIFHIDLVQNSGIMVPEMVDYTHIGLFKKMYSSKGIVTKAEYYETFEQPATYGNLIVQTEFLYGYANDIYTDVTTTVSWYGENDQIQHSKQFFRKFLGWESIDFGIEKRNNIVGNTKLFVLSQIGLADGFDLLNTVSVEIGIYIQGPIPPLTSAVQAQVGVKPYMTQQLADEINAILNDVRTQ